MVKIDKAFEMKRIYILLTILYLLSGCGKDKPIVNYELSIVALDPLGPNKNDKFPESIIKLSNPIETSDGDLDNYSPYPVVVERLGFEDGRVTLNIVADEKKSNTNKIKYRQNWVKKFFDDAKIGKILSSENEVDYNSKNLLKEYLSDKNDSKYGVFYFSETSDLEQLNGKLIYDNIDSLVKTIGQFLIDNPSSKIIVIINPPVDQNTKNFTGIDRPQKGGRTKENIAEDKRAPSKQKLTNRDSPGEITNNSEPTLPPPPPKVLGISLNSNSISWTNMGDDFEYLISVSSIEGEGAKFTFERTIEENNINVMDFRIKDNRKYVITINAKSPSQSDVKSKKFNLINNGSQVDPRCRKSKQ
jgi:hypothetical protein